ncbi:hypothetical protein GCM10028805_48840 [Spirosoma harenae]
MTKLSRTQLDLIADQIQQTNPHQALQAELIDHVASLIEQRMDTGQTFSDATEQVMQQANTQVMAQLKQLYFREFTNQPSLMAATTLRTRIRQKRRPATKPFQYMFLSSVLTFFILMGFLIVVSRPLAVPMDAFRTAWGGVGLTGLLILRWWLSNKSRKSKRTLTIN